MKTYKVAIVEDQADFRNWLIEELELVEQFECVGAFEYAEEALKVIPTLDVDIVLMDLELEGSDVNGIGSMLRLKLIDKSINFLVVTSHSDDELVFEALKVGAGAYILKSDVPDKLGELLGEFAEGGAPMSSVIAKKVIRSFHKPPEQVKELERLSPREREVIGLISKGFFNKEIADRIGVAENTVKTIAHRVYQKLQVNNRVEAVIKYLNL